MVHIKNLKRRDFNWENSKSERETDRQTDKRTDRQRFILKLKIPEEHRAKFQHAINLYSVNGLLTIQFKDRST